MIATKPKDNAENSAVRINPRKPDGRPKVKMGSMKNVTYISETLFDEDLKR